MKKAIAFLLTVALMLASAAVIFAPSSSAEEQQPTVYLSDNGNDENDGLTEEKAVKTYERAQEVLGGKGGIILIPDVYTYPSSAKYDLHYVQGASYTFRGVKQDGSSRFVHGRKNMSMTNPFTFDNLTYELTNTWCALIATFNRLEFTSTVKMKPFNNTDERNNYLFVYGGGQSRDGKLGQNVNLILNGGTFGYVVGGCQKAETYGDVNITFGGTATIKNRLYCGCEGTPGDVMGKMVINITGGTIVDNIYLGGVGAEGDSPANFVTGPSIDVKVTGGTFKSIVCLGTYDSPVSAKITIDVSEYGDTDAAWVESHVLKATDKTTVITKESKEQATEKATEQATEQITEKATEQATEQGTENVTGSVTEAPTGIETEIGETGTAAEENSGEKSGTSGGCSSVVFGGVAMIFAVAAGAAVCCRKKQK